MMGSLLVISDKSFRLSWAFFGKFIIYFLLNVMNITPLCGHPRGFLKFVYFFPWLNSLMSSLDACRILFLHLLWSLPHLSKFAWEKLLSTGELSHPFWDVEGGNVGIKGSGKKEAHLRLFNGQTLALSNTFLCVCTAGWLQGWESFQLPKPSVLFPR